MPSRTSSGITPSWPLPRPAELDGRSFRQVKINAPVALVKPPSTGSHLLPLRPDLTTPAALFAAKSVRAGEPTEPPRFADKRVTPREWTLQITDALRNCSGHTRPEMASKSATSREPTLKSLTAKREYRVVAKSVTLATAARQVSKRANLRLSREWIYRTRRAEDLACRLGISSTELIGTTGREGERSFLARLDHDR